MHFAGPAEREVARSLEHAVVQDADRLDALGAIGVARAFSFGGHFGRAMFDPDDPPDLEMGTEAYRKNRGSTINHFFEKLLRLQDRMLTATGRELAARRHPFVVRFVQEFLEEFFADGDPPPDWASLIPG